MSGTIGLLALVLVPFVVALVATRAVGERAPFVVGCAVLAELITIPLTHWWSRYAAARALARARAGHRDVLIAHAPQSFPRQLVVCVVLTIVAAAIAVATFTLARPARS
jgi:hypothetical protein